MPTPALLQSPESDVGLKRGFDALAELMAVTLGPTQGNVLCESPIDSSLEVLTDSATIARRILALPNRTEDVGAMLMRNLVWRMNGRAGDGCATAAVLAQAILREAYRYKAAGANAMLLQRGLKRAAITAIEALQAMARPVEDEEDLVGVAEAITAEPALSLILSEMFDILGPAAYITIQDYVAPYLERDYQDGGRWVGRLASPYFITHPARRRAILSECQVAIFAGPVTSLAELQPLLEIAAQNDGRKLVLVAYEVKGEALAGLITNHQKKSLPNFAVELRRLDAARRFDCDDLAALTGATVISPETGRSLASITAADLGIVRQAEADADEAVFVGTPQRSRQIRAYLAELQAHLTSLPEEDEAIDALRLRIARLSGHVATLKIGAFTEAARKTMRQKAEKALRALPLAMREGIVPGGGVAFLNCIPAVRQVIAEADEGWGVDILAKALEAPFRRIVENVGLDAADVALHRAQQRGPTFGYNAMTGQIVDVVDAGILDAAGVLRLALETAVSGAAMALTTDTVVLHRNPKQSLQP